MRNAGALLRPSSTANRYRPMRDPTWPFEGYAEQADGLPTIESISAVIGLIYDCAVDPARWDKALAALTGMFNCHGALLVMFDLTQGRAVFSKAANIPSYWLAQLDQHAAELAAWKRLYYPPDWPIDEPQANSRNIPQAVLEQSRVNREWNAPQGLVDTMQLVLMRSPTRHAQLALSRRREVGVVTEREMTLGRLLLPHIRRAAMISDVIDLKTIERERAHLTLDTFRAGIVMTDDRGHIYHANKAAEAMFKAGCPVTNMGGVIRANDPAATVELCSAIARASNGNAALGNKGLAVRLTSPGDPPMLAHVLPLDHGEVRSRLQPGAAAAIFIGPAADAATGAEAMSTAYDLSPTETRLLDGLLCGQKLVEAGRKLGIAETTARTHLGNIFAKTGVSRQSDLVRLATKMGAPGA